MNCPWCGTELVPGASFCPVCGSQVASQADKAGVIVDTGRAFETDPAADADQIFGADRDAGAGRVGGPSGTVADVSQPAVASSAGADAGQPAFASSAGADAGQPAVASSAGATGYSAPQVQPGYLQSDVSSQFGDPYQSERQQSSVAPAPSPVSASPAKKRGSKKKLVACLVAAVIAVGGGIAGFTCWQQTQHQEMVDRTTAAVKKVVDDRYGTSFEGFVPNNYVTPSPYKVKSVKVDNVMEANGLVSGTAKVVTENRSFRSSMALTFNGSKGSDGTVSNVSLKLEKKSTEPTRGIDFDEQNGLKDLDPELDGDSCTVKQEIPGGAPWYYDASYHEEYDYSFDEDDGWSLEDSGRYSDDGDADPMLDISGTYEDAGGASTPDIYLKVSNYNEDEQTVSVELGTDYSLSSKHMSGHMVFKKDDVKLEEVDEGSQFKCFRIGDGGGAVTSPEEITGADGGSAALWFVLNPTVPGGINVFKGDDNGLYVDTGYVKRGRFGTIPVSTKVNGGMMAHLSKFSEYSFANNPPAPQFTKQ